MRDMKAIDKKMSETFTNGTESRYYGLIMQFGLFCSCIDFSRFGAGLLVLKIKRRSIRTFKIDQTR